jgi:biopolymer transport protein ExbD
LVQASRLHGAAETAAPQVLNGKAITMRRKRKKKQRLESEVTLNLAAMLDMAFQLLAFFILTFQPPLAEGDVRLRLPPPMPTITDQNAQAAGSDEKNPNPVQGLNTLTITVLGSPDGSIRQIAIGDTPIAGLGALDSKLKSIFGDPKLEYNQVILQLGSTLNYDQVMQVVDVCTRQKLPSGDKLSKLSLVEAPQ